MPEQQRKRARKGTHSITKRPDGTWRGCAYVGKNVDGTPKRRWYAGVTQGEVRSKIDADTARGGGTLRPRAAGTVGEFIDAWLEDQIKPPERSQGTYDTYSAMWTHAKPIIGHIALEKFSVDDVKELYKTLKARKRFRKSDQTYHEVPSVAQKVGRVVSRAINVAINEGKYNQLNPFARVTRPRHISKRGRAFNEDELGCFLDAAFGDRYYAFWVLLIDAGVRQSEAFGLEWTDIDFKKAQIHITKQRLEGKGGSYIARTKTEAGNRTIQINNVTVAALRVHQKSKNATSQRYVFTTETGGRPTRTNLRSRHFLPICKAAGLTGPGLRIHGTRHTMTSILLANGHPVHVVQGRLGHASKVMVGLYSHVQPGQDRKLADTMERYTKSRARKRNSQ